jgi:hypothetical protein
MTIRVVTMVQRKQNLHKVVPYGVLRDWLVVFLRLLDDSGQVPTPAIFHEYVEDPCISVNVSVMVPDYVLVVQVFENISGFGSISKGATKSGEHDVHFCHYLLAIMFAHAFKVELLPRKNLSFDTYQLLDRATWRLEVQPTCPSAFLLTLRMIPKDPFPMMSRASYWSRNELIGSLECV